ALTALDTKHFSIQEGAKWTREKLVAELLGNQIENGAWSLFTSSTGAASYDITAMALIGLAPYNNQPAVKEAINKAVSFLSEKQGDTGGFNDPWNGGISVETTAQVIIGLTANDIDPLGELFTKNGINLMDNLLSFQAKDGGFKHLIDDT
ncbi:terpene cyclase/mutase family protein, partial [Microvirga sp. 3-52]|nr:terpene cyclase/mutase family protein [Microvirga sp. 3-52]